MYAVLGWTDGFGNDTYVCGIFSTYDEAREYTKMIYQRNYNVDKNFLSRDIDFFRWVQFDFGEVDFEWYEANDFEDIEI